MDTIGTTKILFWNIHGLTDSKARELHSYLNEFDVIILVETFVEEKNYAKIQRHLPSNYTWIWTAANRTLQRGRASAGLVMGIKKEHSFSGYWDDKEQSLNGVSVVLNGVDIDIVGVYNRNGLRKIKDVLDPRLEQTRNKRSLILGDWNARTGKISGRESRDTTEDKEGVEFVDWMEDCGYEILNGRTNGDWNGEITHVDYRSHSVIDYATANEEMREYIDSFRVGNKTQSDHFPIEVTLTTANRHSRTVEEDIVISDYSPEGIEVFKANLAMKKAEPKDNWRQISNQLKDSVPKKTRRIGPRKDTDWWTTECYLLRRDMSAALRTARVDPCKWKEYKEAKRKYKDEIRRCKESKVGKEMEQLRNIKNINGAWKYIKNNRYSATAELPEPEEMVEHFVNLLEGDRVLNTEQQLNGEDSTRVAINREDCVVIDEEELLKSVAELKCNKACGPDGLKAEVLIHADQETKDAIRGIMNRCLLGEDVPDEWREARIHPIHKKGDPKVASNYRGIAISNAMYKLYANILYARLQRYVDANNLLPDTQNGFRPKRSAIDNIYVLNHTIGKTLRRNKRLYCAFIDFKAAFDTINREILFNRLKKIGIPAYIIEAIKNIYKTTLSTINGTTFRQTNGLRQGCPLSPLLFALYIGDLDETFAGQQCGGTVISRRLKIFCLSYADDLVLIAETPEELQEMLKVLNRYANRKRLTVNVDKSKVMRFAPGSRVSNVRWTYNGEQLEEVRTFKYLGYVFQINGGSSSHVQEMVSAAKRSVSQTWSIAQRKFTNNFAIRDQMFRSIVLPTMTYACEITGFAEHKDIEIQARKYYRWTLALQQSTRNAVVYDETKTYPVWITTGFRAMQYEERSRESPCEILRVCVQQVQEGEGNNRLIMDREGFCNRGGWSGASVSEMVVGGWTCSMALKHRQMMVCDQLNGVKIAHLRYAHIRCPGLPIYLKRNRHIQLIARFRCENEERGRDHWRSEKQCRICKKAEETLEHMAKECCPWIGPVRRMLNITGEGARVMERIVIVRELQKGRDGE